MFTNKHVVAALLITPVLAVLGYFAVDALVSEKPHKAIEGASYALVAKSNCRYTSGRCDFSNGDFKASVKLEAQAGQVLVKLSSAFPVDGVKVSLSDAGNANPIPVDLKPGSEDFREWQGMLSGSLTGEDIMRVALSSQGSYYYGETGTVFARYETGFGADFRK